MNPGMQGFHPSIHDFGEAREFTDFHDRYSMGCQQFRGPPGGQYFDAQRLEFPGKIQQFHVCPKH